MRFDPRANVTKDAASHNAKVPELHLFGQGHVELLEYHRTPCAVTRPSGLKTDSLAIKMVSVSENYSSIKFRGKLMPDNAFVGRAVFTKCYVRLKQDYYKIKFSWRTSSDPNRIDKLTFFSER